MKFPARLAMVAVASFTFAGGLGFTAAAHAEAVSAEVTIAHAGSGCGSARAGSYNTGTQRGQLNVTGHIYVVGDNCPSGIKDFPSGYLGSSAYLKTTGGSVCSSVGVTYSTTTTAYKSSMAYLYSPCVRPSQLSGGGVGYFYNGGGYSSRGVQAPYQLFS